MISILYGGIPNSAKQLLERYAPSDSGFTLVELGNQGLRAKVSKGVRDAGTAMVILGESLYSQCVGKIDSCLENPKVHKFVNMGVLADFLDSQFMDSNRNVNISNIDMNANTNSNTTDFSFVSDIFGSDVVLPSSSLDVSDTTQSSANIGVVEIDILRRKLSEAELVLSQNKHKLEQADEAIKRNKLLEDEVLSVSEQVRVLREKVFEYRNQSQADKQRLEKLIGVEEQYRDLHSKSTQLKGQYDLLARNFKALSTQKVSCDAELESYKSRLKSLQSKYDALAESTLEYNKLVSEHKLLETKYSDMQSSYAELNTNHQTLKSRVSDLTEKVSYYEGANGDLTEKVSSLNKELSELQDELRSSSAENESLSNKLAELTSLISQFKLVEEKVEKLSVENSSLSNELSNLKSNYNSKDNECKSLHESVSTLKETISDKDIQLNDSNKEIARLTASLGKVTNDLQELQDSYGALVTESSNLSSDLDDAKDKYKNSLLQITELSNKCSSLENDKKLSSEELSRLRESLGVSESKISAYTSSIADLELEVKNKSTELKAVQAQILDLTNLIGSLRKEKEEVETRLLNNASAKESSLVEQVNALTQESNALNKKVTELQGYLSEERKSSQLLQNHIDTLTSKLDTKESENTDLVLRLSKLEEENRSLVLQLDESKEANISIVSKGDDLSSRLLEVQSDLNEERQKNKQLSENNKILKDNLTDSFSIRDSLVTEKSELADTIKNLENEISQLHNDIDNLDRERSNLKNLNLEYESKISTLTFEVQSLKDYQNSSKKDEDSVELVRYKTLYENTQSKLGKLEEKLEKTLDTKVDLQQQLDDCRNLLNMYESKSVSLSNSNAEEIKELQGTITKLEIELANNDSDVLRVELNSTKDSLELVQGQVDELQERCAKQEVELKESNEKVIQLRGMLEEKDSCISDLMAKDKSDEVSALNNDISKLKLSIAELNTIIQDKDSELDEIRQNLFYKVSDSLQINSKADEYLFEAQEGYKNITVIASGSNSSFNDAEDFILNEMSVLSSTNKYIILDLATGGTLDLHFSCNSTRCVDWLLNKDILNNCLSATKFSNVYMMTLSTVEVNSMYLLSINWLDKLRELNNTGYRVVINIGSLGNFVTNVLFNTFNKCCVSLVVTKSRPSSMRALLINARQYSNLGYTTLVFIDLADNMRNYFSNFNAYKTVTITSNQTIKI